MTTDVQVLPWAEAGSNARQLLSRHYAIYTTCTSREMLSNLPGYMEAARDNYLRITGLTDRPAEGRMPIYMMATRREWSDLTRSVVGKQWNVYSALEAGGYCYKGVCVFWDTGGVGSLAIASHEGLHQFLGRRLKDHLPMWAEEGLATLAEGYQVRGNAVRFTPQRNASRFTDLRNAILNDWWIPLDKLLAMDAGDAVRPGDSGRAVGYSGQLWALAIMLMTDPVLAPRRARMLADAEDGLFDRALGLAPGTLARSRPESRAYNRRVSVPLFKHYIAADLVGFEQKYKAFAGKLARTD